MDAKKRIEVRAELASQGYAWDYIDSWTPKTTLYAHKDMLNTVGQVVRPRGTPYPNQPGHPDHAARKSRIGLLPWPPSVNCKCRACREVVAEIETFAVASPEVSPTVGRATVTGVRGRPRKNKSRTPTGLRTRKGE